VESNDSPQVTYGHLRADCLYTGIISGPTLGIEYGMPYLFLGDRVCLSVTLVYCG